MNGRPKRAIKNIGTVDVASEDEEDFIPPEKQPRKRRAPANDSEKSKKPVKRTRVQGRLKSFVTKLPVELITFVLKLAGPQAVMNVSRVNKEFRQLLVDDEYSDSIWKAAREEAGMPDLVSTDITQRQYILLIFDKNCHNCGKSNVQEIDFLNCARLCSPCRAETRLNTAKQLEKYLARLHPQAFSCAKSSAHQSGHRIPRGIVKLSAKLRNLPSAAVAPFVEARQVIKRNIEEERLKILQWLAEEDNRKYENDKANMESRKAAIKERLLALPDWNEQLLGTAWEHSKYAEQPVRLSEQIWKRIQTPLIKFLQHDLAFRRRRALEAQQRYRLDTFIFPRYRNLLQTHPCPDLFPSRETFINLPCVKACWEVDSTPLTDNLSWYIYDAFREAEWAAVPPFIDAYVTAYQVEMTEIAVARLRKAYDEPDASRTDDKILQDSRSMFRYKPAEPSYGDWNGEADLVLPFPAIHGRMRDRQDGMGVGMHLPVAADFKNVKEMAWRGFDESLMVDLGARP